MAPHSNAAPLLANGKIVIPIRGPPIVLRPKEWPGEPKVAD